MRAPHGSEAPARRLPGIGLGLIRRDHRPPHSNVGAVIVEQQLVTLTSVARDTCGEGPTIPQGMALETDQRPWTRSIGVERLALNQREETKEAFAPTMSEPCRGV